MRETEQQGEKRRSTRRLHILWWALAAVLLAVWVYLPLPYYVTQPGSAVALAPIVDVQGGSKDEKGSFMLTTVRMGEATPAWYVYAMLSPDVDLIDKDLVLDRGETNDEFTRRELEVMRGSQQVAEAVAFQRAGYRVKIDHRGVLVMGTLAGMPAKNVLQVGDVITAVDGRQTLTTGDLLRYLERKKPGDRVEVTYIRDGKQEKRNVALSDLPDETGKPTGRAGLGIRPEDDQEIEIPRRVTISSEGIGGPSAGLMFTLEIYNQLRKDADLTRGYRIAGTGTINLDGTVGRIGGIGHKVVAADRAGAEIFFAPDDKPLDPSTPSNYEEALAAAKRIGTSMRIVPVKTVDDAIRYLMSLPPKRS